MKRFVLFITSLLLAGGLLLSVRSQSVRAQGPGDEHVVYLPIILTGNTSPPPPSPAPAICEGDLCIIRVLAADAAASELPIIFKVPRQNIIEIPPQTGVANNQVQTNVANGGYHVTGTLMVETPVGDMTIVKADLIFERGNSPLADVERVRGRAELPFPWLGFVDLGVPDFPSSEGRVMAEVGLDRGKNLTSLDLPLRPERQYLFFNLEATAVDHLKSPFDSVSGAITYTISAGEIFVIDPLDPSYYTRFEIPNAGTFALGRSTQGLIPYEPANTYGISEHVGQLTAHQYDEVVGIGVPEIKLPLAVDGASAVNFDPNNEQTYCFKCITAPSLMLIYSLLDGEPLEEATEHSGIYDGNLYITLPLPGDLELEVEGYDLLDFALLGASAGTTFTPDAKYAYFTGLRESDPWQEISPIHPQSTVRSYGFVSDVPTDFYMQSDGVFELKRGILLDLFNIDIMPLVMTGTSRMDLTSRHFTGVTRSRIYPDIILNGEAQTEAFFSFLDTRTSYITIDGEFAMPAVGLEADALATVDASGLLMEGTFDYDASLLGSLSGVNLKPLQINGTLRSVAGGYRLQGTTTSQIHPDIVFNGQATVDAFLSTADNSKSYFKMTGDLKVAGIGLSTDAFLRVDKSGVLVRGKYADSLAKVSLSGKVTSAGPDLTGSIGVKIPVNSGAVKGTYNGTVTLRIRSGGINGTVSGHFCQDTFLGPICTQQGGRVVFTKPPQVCITVPVSNEEKCKAF